MGGCTGYYCDEDDDDCPPVTPVLEIAEEGETSCVAVPAAYKAEAFVIPSLPYWQNFWDDHTGCLGPPAPALPDVDFTHQTVVAVVCSERPTTGYSVRVDGVEAWCGTLEVSAVESQPGAGCVTAPAATRPYQFVVVEGVYDFFVFRAYYQEVVDCP
jgi:hypothetical protein